MISPIDAEDGSPKECSRTIFVMVLVCMVNGASIYTDMVSEAISNGATGYIIGYVITFLCIGIPMMYMEFIISQFTSRDCLDVWKAHACLSHIGYVQISWQIFFIIYNHIATSFVIHYFLISFEEPIPYHSCGPWGTHNCNIATMNYTVNQDCIKMRSLLFPHCKNLYKTFPEVQYWYYYILGNGKPNYYVAWRVCLGSGITSVVTYLSCFKRSVSLKWFIWFFTIYPTIVYCMLLIGSMMQKGLVEIFEDALDTEFKVFARAYHMSEIINNVVFTLLIGSGIPFNLGGSSSFRAPCYSNVVINVVTSSAFVVLMTSTTAMTTCPYAYQYNTLPEVYMNLPITHTFEKIPRLFKEFDKVSFWLILIYSCHATMGLSSSSVVILSLLETFATKYKVVNKYIGLFTFGITISLFLITMPLLGNTGVFSVLEFNRFLSPITVLLGMLENVVFVMWYGIDKFSEDVHFMQGIQPTACLKVAWVASGFVLGYAFITESYVVLTDDPLNFGPGRCMLILYLFLILFLTPIRVLVAACKSKFTEAIKLDPMWGPRSELLMRSRAMFSAQAMTKEYMYRQYHLQAGIKARQRAANVRRDGTIPL